MASADINAIGATSITSSVEHFSTDTLNIGANAKLSVLHILTSKNINITSFDGTADMSASLISAGSIAGDASSTLTTTMTMTDEVLDEFLSGDGG